MLKRQVKDNTKMNTDRRSACIGFFKQFLFSEIFSFLTHRFMLQIIIEYQNLM